MRTSRPGSTGRRLRRSRRRRRRNNRKRSSTCRRSSDPGKQPFLRNFVYDEWRMLSSPFRRSNYDTPTLKKYIIPFALISTALIATDKKTADFLPNTEDQAVWSGRVSQLGAAYTLAGCVWRDVPFRQGDRQQTCAGNRLDITRGAGAYAITNVWNQAGDEPAQTGDGRSLLAVSGKVAIRFHQDMPRVRLPSRQYLRTSTGITSPCQLPRILWRLSFLPRE